MADIKEAPNKEAIIFFEEVRKLFPLNEKGEIDTSKVDYHILEGKENSPALQYLCQKLPEFFSRGSTMFQSLYEITGKTDENPTQSFDEQLFDKLRRGDLSDLKEFEKLFPYIQTITKFVGPKLYEMDEFTNKKIWLENLVIPELLEQYPQFKAVYEQIVKDNGMYKFQGSLSGYDALNILKSEATPEEAEEVEFALKVTKYWELAESEEMFNSRDFELLEYETEREKKNIEERKRELEQAKRELKDIDKKIESYNVLTSLFKKKEKVKDLEKRVEIVKKIQRYEGTISDVEDHIKENEEKIKFIKRYEENYNKAVTKYIVPKIKETLGENLSDKEKETLYQLIDRVFTNKSNNVSSLKRVDDIIHSLHNRPFNEYLSKLNNALITIAGMSKSLIEFEKQDEKTLYSLLEAARGELMNVPTDGDHGKLEEGYRKHNLSSFSDFMESTVEHQYIPKAMENLNKQFEELMKEEDLEEYIKKAGKIWYQFVQIHPFTDGNGRTGRYMLNMLLAHKNIVIPALYNSRSQEYQFNHSLDEFIIRRLHSDYDGMSEEFLNRIRAIAIDLTGKNRLKKDIPEFVAEETSLEENGGPKI